MKTKDAIRQLKEIEQRDGIITPQAIVEMAKEPTHPFHGIFEWNDGVAADKYRLYQARNLINSYRVEIKGRDLEAFQNVFVTVNDVKTQGYKSTEVVLENKDFKAQVVRQALREIKYWDKKYQDLNELEGVINEDKVQEVEDSLSL